MPGLLAVAADRLGDRIDAVARQDLGEFASGYRRRASFHRAADRPRRPAPPLASRSSGRLSKTARVASRLPFQATMAVPKLSTGFAGQGRTITGRPTSITTRSTKSSSTP